MINRKAWRAILSGVGESCLAAEAVLAPNQNLKIAEDRGFTRLRDL